MKKKKLHKLLKKLAGRSLEHEMDALNYHLQSKAVLAMYNELIEKGRRLLE